MIWEMRRKCQKSNEKLGVFEIFWEYTGWMEQGHLSKFHICGSLRMSRAVWKNTSWRSTIWLKTERQAVVILDCRKLRRHRDYRQGDVNCLSPMLKQSKMRIGFRWYKKYTCFALWIRLGHIKLLFYFLVGAFFLTVSKLWESLLCLF